MNKNKIRELIKMGENQKIEFKSKIIDGLGDSICSFANTNNGVILVGVSDKGQILGIDKKYEEKIANIAHTCKPSIYPNVENVKIENKNIFVIEIKKSHSLHSFKNIAYKRIASHDKPLSPEEAIELVKYTKKMKWDEQICKEAKLTDIDWAFIQEIFIPLYEETSEKKIAGKPKQIIESLGCIKTIK